MLKRTKQFGYDCVDPDKLLDGNYLRNHIRGQLIRSSTSVCANYWAARLAQSKATFIAKISISLEEADESAIWLEMIIDKTLMPDTYQDETKRLMNEASGLTSIFKATGKTMEEKHKRNL